MEWRSAVFPADIKKKKKKKKKKKTQQWLHQEQKAYLYQSETAEVLVNRKDRNGGENMHLHSVYSATLLRLSTLKIIQALAHL